LRISSIRRGRLKPIAPTTIPSRAHAATNLRSATEPSTTRTSSARSGNPTDCTLTSYWSDQNDGIGA